MKQRSTALVALLLLGCSPKERAEQRNFSPDETMYFVTPVDPINADAVAPSVVLEITGTNGAAILRENTGASSKQDWRAYWASKDEIVFDSSDIRLMKWRLGTNGHWAKTKE
jgi:hypothetical protein